MKQQNWFAIEITAESKVSEAIEFALNELDSLGNEINNLGKKSFEDICVVGYFNELPNEETLESQLHKSLEIYNFPQDSIKNISTKKVENQDWLAEWKKYWKPTETNKFIIAPPWENIKDDDKIVINIEPNMAFGTGTHETTQLCLKAIEELYKPKMSFFDVGTGTGILSIAVSKLRAKSREIEEKNAFSPDSRLSTLDSILACDVDEDSVKIAKENSELNNAKEIEFYVGSITETSPKFDFVCANVTADIITPMLSLLISKAKNLLLLSGILVEQKDLILNELKKYEVTNVAIETQGEWISMVMDFAD